MFATTRLPIDFAGGLNLPPNPVIAAIGDSLTDVHTDIVGNDTRAREDGWLNWWNYLNGNPAPLIPANNYGNSGDTTTAMLARTDTALAASPSADVWFIMGGTNDYIAGSPPPSATVISNLQEIANRVQAADKLAVLVTAPIPIGLTTGQRALADAVTAWIAGLTPTSSLIPIDTTGVMLSGGVPIADTFNNDGIHPAMSGAYLTGNELTAPLASIFPPKGVDDLPGTDILRLDMSGTGGTGMTGALAGEQAAAGTVTSLSGTFDTAISEKTAGDKQRYALNPSASSGSAILQCRNDYVVPSDPEWTPGDTLYGWVDVELTGLSKVRAIQVGAEGLGGTAKKAFGNFAVLASSPFEYHDYAQGERLLIRTPDVTTDASNTLLRVNLLISIDASDASPGSVDLTVHEMGLKKV